MTSTTTNTPRLSEEPTWEECAAELDRLKHLSESAVAAERYYELNGEPPTSWSIENRKRAAIYAKLAALARQQKDQGR